MGVTRPGRTLPPGKGSTVPIGHVAGWAPETVWTQRLEERISFLYRGSNLDLPVVQSVARHYTAWDTSHKRAFRLFINTMRTETSV
jgi:hypothetical protein